MIADRLEQLFIQADTIPDQQNDGIVSMRHLGFNQPFLDALDNRTIRLAKIFAQVVEVVRLMCSVHKAVCVQAPDVSDDFSG